jgi:hypothetical protein
MAEAKQDEEYNNYYASGLFDIESSPAFKALDILRSRPNVTKEQYPEITPESTLTRPSSSSSTIIWWISMAFRKI